MRRRPSTLTRVASARTTLPMPTGARWSNWTRVATLVWVDVRCPSVARQGGLLAHGDEPGRRQHRDVARAEVPRRVLLAHRQLHLGREARVRPVPRGRVLLSEDGLGTTITIPPVTDTSLIDPDVLHNVLSAALAHGGDMAEVFAEDSHDGQRHARRPPGRGALVRPLPGRRHPGRGRRDDRVRPHLRPERGGPPGRRRRGGVGGPRGRRQGADGGDGAGPAGRPRPRRQDPARARCPSRPSSTSWSAPTRRRGRRAAPSARCRWAAATAGAAS